jgi:ABC-2 type transport system ATP-binding protein
MNGGRSVADDAVGDLLSGGDDQTYRITSRDIDEALVAHLQGRFDVVAVDRRDGATRIEVATDSDGFYDLAATLRDNDVRLDDLHTVRGDLEDVFLSLTGSDSRE